MPAIEDTVSAFMPYPFRKLVNAETGPLAGKTFAVKDLFEVEGYPTGCGCPLKLAESELATENAKIVKLALEAGAKFVGKTKTDELAWSLEGINQHFGTPINPKAQGRIPGGSSSGSAAAVAAGLVDFAIGSDTGGSIRAPASFCGLWGIRPTHGRLPLDGCMELAASFDTCGFFARDGQLFETVAKILYEESHTEQLPNREHSFLFAVDMFEKVTPSCRKILEDNLPIGRENTKDICVYEDMEEEIYHSFRIIQASEVLKVHGAWVKAKNPPLGRGVADRFKFADTIGPTDVESANAVRSRLVEALNAKLKDGRVIIAPTVPCEAPLLETDSKGMDEFRHEALALLCVAGHCGLPQVSIPITFGPDGTPLGLSLIGPKGSDMELIRLGRRLYPEL